MRSPLKQKRAQHLKLTITCVAFRKSHSHRPSVASRERARLRPSRAWRVEKQKNKTRCVARDRLSVLSPGPLGDERFRARQTDRRRPLSRYDGGERRRRSLSPWVTEMRRFLLAEEANLTWGEIIWELIERKRCVKSSGDTEVCLLLLPKEEEEGGGTGEEIWGNEERGGQEMFWHFFSRSRFVNFCEKKVKKEMLRWTIAISIWRRMR